MKNQITPAYHVRNPPDKRPLMVFDGDCGFCRFWIARWNALTGNTVDYEPFQEVAGRFPEIPREVFENAVQLVEPDGKVTGGADAVFRVLEYSRKIGWLPRVLMMVPGFPGVSRVAYRFVANHRTEFSFLTRLLWGRVATRPTYLVARWVFVRVIGLVYFIAFLSLLLQIRGLAGKRGILPAGEYLDAMKGQYGTAAYWRLPTLCWFGSSDQVLVALCVAGAAISCVVMCGFLPSICLFFLWTLYLSLFAACNIFLGFQWDILLLQTGFLTIFLAPLSLRPAWKVEGGGARIARWLLLWLLFCLMLESGVVKLTWGDRSWLDFTALTYHYQTQPLPLWTSWYMNQAPLWFQTMSVLYMYVAELAAPFSVFGPRNVRRAGAAVMISLQLLIAGTGNYCFFNLITIALCLLLLDDDAWPAWCRNRLLNSPRGRGLQWSPWLVAPVAGVDLLMSAMQIAYAFRAEISWPVSMVRFSDAVSSFCTFNGYGLFRTMTKSRPEIIVEGSNDGETWLPYEFKWKPGDVNRCPGLVAPFQPRLDWQMWFAAFGSYQENPWFIFYLRRLLEGSPDVIGLMASNPFPAAPPRYIRASLYDYKFTKSGDNTRAWWKRKYLGPYCPILSLSSFRKTETFP